MRLAYFFWNSFLPNFFKNFIKKKILSIQYKNINLSRGTIQKISILDIINKVIQFDNNVSLYETSIRGNFKIGEYSYINGPNTFLFSLNNYKIEIGRYCCVAMNTNMITYNDHLSNKLTNYPFIDYKEQHHGGDIIIGNDVWIGMNCIILPGIKIGNGAVIGAGTIVTKDVPDYAIYAGNPGKVIKYRFDENTINNLLKLERWNWDIEKVKKNYNLDFLNNNTKNE
ncbi:CatB-related O-acetyltransferase [Candidatus Gracilibacteria bacterium]|nr:CatB-related O-acetyltransferase [Candidatus Gracilibacteria bacterium]NUJ99023.1 CatB-related O-acetyltransferase [Candidatus Gracilibacteria bacterium]